MHTSARGSETQACKARRLKGATPEGRASASRGLFSFRLWTEFQRVESRFTGSLRTPYAPPVTFWFLPHREIREGRGNSSACPPYLFRLAAAEQPSSHPRREGKRRDGAASAASSGCEGRGGVLTCVSGKRPTCRRGGSGSSSTITSHIKGRLAPPGEPVPVQRHRVEPGKKTSPRNARRNWYKYCGPAWSHSTHSLSSLCRVPCMAPWQDDWSLRPQRLWPRERVRCV